MKASGSTLDGRDVRGGAPAGGGPPLGGSPLAAAAAAAFLTPLPRRGGGVWAFVLAIVTAGALAHVGVRFKGLEVAYDLGRERRIATEMEEQRRRLQIEIGMLKDPRRVIAIARDRLNMGPPPPQAIWRLGGGRSVRDWLVSTATATPATTATTTSPATANVTATGRVRDGSRPAGGHGRPSGGSR